MKLPIEGRWIGLMIVIAAGFAGVLLLAVKFVRLPESAQHKKPAANGGFGLAPLGVVKNGSVLSDDVLFDPDALFLPTQYNASQLDVPKVVQREPGTSFQPIVARYAHTPNETSLVFPEVAVVPARPVEALTYGWLHNEYDVLGHFERQETSLPARLAVVEVVSTDTGRPLLTAPLASAEAPAAVIMGDWRPLELLVGINSAGLVSSPTLTKSSGAEVVDGFFRGFLAKSFHLGERLPPGYYAVRVGP